MLLTEEQLHAIKQIVDKYHSAFIVNTISPKAVAASVLDDLKKQGLVKVTVSSIEDAYLYGQVLAAMQNPQAATMSYGDFKKWVQKNPIPLSPIEQQAVNMAQMNAGQYARGLGNRVDVATGAILIEADAALRNKMKSIIQDKTAENIARRESVKQLKSDLGWATSDWARDWDRIAITEKHNAMQAGMSDHITKRHGPDALVAKRPMPDACKHCQRLHLGPDGHPRIFKLSELEKFGTNVGRKAADWKPTVGAVHPHCQCQLIRIPAGWGFDKHGDLVPGGEFGEKYEDASELAMSLLQEDDLRKSIEGGDRAEFQGLSIFIENKVGSIRTWKDGEGGTGETTMYHAYGYIEGVAGDDEDELDCFIGPDPRAKMAYVIDQQNPQNGIYDERKVMLGFPNQEEAEQAYVGHYNRPDFKISVSPMDMDAFKRWIKLSPVQKSQSSEPRLVLLEKARTTAEEAAHDSRADARAPSEFGTGVNYYFDYPEKEPTPTLKEQGQELHPNDILKPKEKRQAIKKDKKIYDMINPGAKEAVDLNIPETKKLGGSPIGSGLAERNREWIDDHAKKLSGPPNTDPQKRRKKKKAPKLVLSKAFQSGGGTGGSKGSYKYIDRKWMKDHWVYKYADHHGGKVRGHDTSMDHVMLKVPHEKLGKLEAFKKQYGLSGKIITGGKNVILSISKTEADALKKHDKSKGKQGKAKEKPKVEPTVPVQAKNIKMLKDLEQVDKNIQTTPPTHPGYLHSGHAVSVDGQPGTVFGFDMYGNPIVEMKSGGKVTATWSQVQSTGSNEYVSLYSKMKKGKVFKLDTYAQGIMDKALEVEPLQGKKLSQYTDELRKKGAEVFLVGGMVRDLIADTVEEGKKSTEEILSNMMDMDIVATANPNALMGTVKEINNQPGHNIKNDQRPFGVIQIGDGTGEGVDLATIVVEGGHDSNPEFDHDLEKDVRRRDFTANSLYYDFYNGVVVDPSGTGVVDAQNKVLRLPPMTKKEQHKNKLLPFRYLKFRERGFKPEEKTLQRIKGQMEEQLPMMDFHALFKAFNRTFFKKGKKFQKTMDAVKETMYADGLGDLYETHIEPRLSKLKDAYKVKYSGY